MNTVNMSFFHNGTQWIARDEDMEVAAPSLTDLDGKLREEVRFRYTPSQGARFTVNLDFDYSTIPHWMIQYHPYYMHRRLEFDY
ncbi:MAG: DUF5395 domain-containing protein [Desulfohalobiaceae bacterium]|nr:DUF5395 domain-containing protein [Desulfohalobiaceae bacterium]